MLRYPFTPSTGTIGPAEQQTGANCGPQRAVLSGDGNHYLFGCTSLLTEVNPGDLAQVVSQYSVVGISVAFSPDSKEVVFAYNNQILIYDSTSRIMTGQYAVTPSNCLFGAHYYVDIQQVAFSRDGQLIEAYYECSANPSANGIYFATFPP